MIYKEDFHENLNQCNVDKAFNNVQNDDGSQIRMSLLRPRGKRFIPHCIIEAHVPPTCPKNSAKFLSFKVIGDVVACDDGDIHR